MAFESNTADARKSPRTAGARDLFKDPEFLDTVVALGVTPKDWMTGRTNVGSIFETDATKIPTLPQSNGQSGEFSLSNIGNTARLGRGMERTPPQSAARGEVEGTFQASLPDSLKIAGAKAEAARQASANSPTLLANGLVSTKNRISFFSNPDTLIELKGMETRGEMQSPKSVLVIGLSDLLDRTAVGYGLSYPEASVYAVGNKEVAERVYKNGGRYDEELIARAQALTGTMGLERRLLNDQALVKNGNVYRLRRENIVYCRGEASCRSLRQKAETYDLIAANGLPTLLAERNEALTILVSKLNPGGTLVVDQPPAGWSHSDMTAVGKGIYQRKAASVVDDGFMDFGSVTGNLSQYDRDFQLHGKEVADLRKELRDSRDNLSAQFAEAARRG